MAAEELPGFVPRVLRADDVSLLRADVAVFDAMLDGWRAQMLARGLEIDTIKTRCRVIARFVDFAIEYSWRWRANDIDQFLAELRSQATPIALSTLRSYSNAISMFCSYVSDSRYGWVDFCEKQFCDVPSQIVFEWNTPQHTTDDAVPPGRRAFTKAELQHLFDIVDDFVDDAHSKGSKRWLTALRDSTAFKIGYAFGLRRRELVMLDLTDFGPNPHVPRYGNYGALTVRWAKGTKGSGPRRRTVLTSPEFLWAVDLLEYWCFEGRKLFATADRSPALWPSERGDRLTLGALGRSFTSFRRLAGLPPELSLHALRHSYTTHLLEAGYDPLFVQQQLGHSYLAINRAAGSDAPFRRFHLASALGNRGSCLTMLERFCEAAVAAEEAIELFREAFDANPGRLNELASALTILERALEPLGQSDRAERRWAGASEALTDETQQARLRTARADAAAYGDHRAVRWLFEAIELSHNDRTCLAAAHETARRHRAPDPQSWDTEWERVTACPAPDWLSVDSELLTAAQTWASIHAAQPKTDQRGLLETGREFLAAHHELLTATADVAVGEALLALDDDVAQRLRAIRSDVATSGLVAAYHTLLVEALLDRFELAGPGEQRVMLDEYGVELTSAEALDAVRRRELETELDVAARRAHALLKLSACEGSDRALEGLFDALDDPSRISDALRTIAVGPAAAVMLPFAAVVGQTATDDPEVVGIAHVFAAIAGTINQDSAVSAEHARLALASAPRSRDRFILLVADVGASQSAALAVVPLLIDN